MFTIRINSYLPNYIKGKNRKVVFDMFLEQQELSRSEIVRQTNMSFPTVLKVVNSLISKNIIIEVDRNLCEDEMKRKSYLLRFNPCAYCAIGVEFDGRFANIGLVNLEGTILEKHSIQLDHFTQTRDLTPLSKSINDIIYRNRSLPILGVGIGFPANINPESGSIIRDSSIDISIETPFREIFNSFFEAVSIPVILENDVNMACTGEAFLRRTRGEELQNLIYFTLSTGCGSGIMLDGKLRRGSHYKSGEIGNMILVEDDFANFSISKKNTFEQIINLEAINRLFHVNLHFGMLLDPSVTTAICDYICPYICAAFYNLITILDVDNFVIAGMIPEILGDEFYRTINQLLNSNLKANEQVTISKPISTTSGIVGGGLTVFDNLLFKLLQEE